VRKTLLDFFFSSLRVRLSFFAASPCSFNLAKCDYKNSKFNKKYLTFAWDRYGDGKLILQGIERCNRAGIPSTNMQFFILIGFDTTKEQDYERVETLRKLGCMPFVMPYNKKDKYQKAYARYVNNRWVFNTCSWEEYKYNPEAESIQGKVKIIDEN